MLEPVSKENHRRGGHALSGGGEGGRGRAGAACLCSKVRHEGRRLQARVPGMMRREGRGCARRSRVTSTMLDTSPSGRCSRRCSAS